MLSYFNPDFTGYSHHRLNVHDNKAVSYTHLDVYKRQYQYSVLCDEAPDTEKSHVVKNFENAAKDVYKRQAYCRGNNYEESLAAFQYRSVKT